MKQLFWRVLGCVLSLVTVYNRPAMADTVSDTYNGLKYTYDTISITGYCTTIDNGNGTLAYSYLNKYSDCYSGSYNNIIAECSGDSYCNATGICCTDRGLFTGASGANYSYTSWLYIVPNTYRFAGCEYDAGYYRTSDDAPCEIITGMDSVAVSSYLGLTGCCAQCPQYFGTPDTGMLGTGVWSTNCASGWCWRATSGVAGLGACRIYTDPDGKEFAGDGGIYVLPTGCPYVE